MPKYVFPKVDLPDVGRSNFNLDKSLMFSFAPGTIRCLWAKDVLPKDHWEISFKASIESMPMLAPLYGKWKATWAYFFEPYSNIYGWMDNNTRRSTQDILYSALIRYTLPLSYDVYSSQSDAGSGATINPLNVAPQEIFEISEEVATLSLVQIQTLNGVASSSIWEDFGWPNGFKGYIKPVIGQGGLGTYGRYFIDISSFGWPSNLTLYDTFEVRTEHLHAVKPLGYLDIIRNYYVNNQFAQIPFVSTSDLLGAPNYLGVVSQEVLDYIFKYLRNLPPDYYSGVEFSEGYWDLWYLFQANPPHDDSPEYSLHQEALAFIREWQRSYKVENGGCFLASYMMDLNRGLMSSSTGTFRSVVDTSNGNFSIDTLRLQNKVQQVIDILDVTRGRFSDWLRGLWSVDIKGDIDKPIYLGSHTQIIATTDIISTATTGTAGSGSSQLGQQAGFSAGTANGRKISFNSDQYGVIYCIFSMVPYVSYSQGFKREDLKTQFSGIFNPRMAQIGYQDVPAKVLLGVTPESFIGYGDNYTPEQTLADFIPEFKPLIFSNSVLSEITADSDVYDFELKRTYLSQAYNPNEIVGRQVAWAEYMADVDESRGLFALDGSLENWVLNRSYNRQARGKC